MPAALSNDDIADFGPLAVMQLNPKILWVRIASMFSSPGGFGSCHSSTLELDKFDFRMITDSVNKIKEWGSGRRADIFLFTSIVLVSLISFGLGRLSVLWEPRLPLSVTTNPEVRAEIEKAAALASQSGGGVVASKNGSVYHLPDCPGALKIKPENKIEFGSIAEAQRAGYKPAGNCPGL